MIKLFGRKKKAIRKVYEIVVRFEDKTSRSFTVPWEEGSNWPPQYQELVDWFFYKSRREVFSFKYKKGVFLFRREDVKTVEVTIEEYEE